MCLEKPLSSSYFFDEIIDLVNAFWQRKKNLFQAIISYAMY